MQCRRGASIIFQLPKAVGRFRRHGGAGHMEVRQRHVLRGELQLPVQRPHPPRVPRRQRLPLPPVVPGGLRHRRRRRQPRHGVGTGALPRGRQQRHRVRVLLPRPRAGGGVRQVHGRQGRVHLLRPLHRPLLLPGLPRQPGQPAGAGLGSQRRLRRPPGRRPVRRARGEPRRRALRLGGVQHHHQVRLRGHGLRPGFPDHPQQGPGAQDQRPGPVHAGPGARPVPPLPPGADRRDAGGVQRHRWRADPRGMVQPQVRGARVLRRQPHGDARRPAPNATSFSRPVHTPDCSSATRYVGRRIGTSYTT
ncbi:hypothetical protein D1007_52360 [Hordeum vulgare]|nr:hypothetical protein D1007_52360 [Hordeum vulgare]